MRVPGVSLVSRVPWIGGSLSVLSVILCNGALTSVLDGCWSCVFC